MKIIFNVVTSSNKKLGIPKTRIAYKVESKKGVYVLHPIIDNISITAKIEDLKIAQNVAYWVGKANQEGGLPLYSLKELGKYKNKETGRYKASAILRVDKEAGALIQIGLPGYPCAIRLEFNPAHFSQGAIDKMDLYLKELSKNTFGLGWFVKVGTITRVDIAVDILGVEFNDLVVQLREDRKVKLYVDKEGGLQTVTSLLDKGFKNMAYDKRAEIQEKGKYSEFEDYPRCRVEWRIGKTKKKLVSLGDIKCPWGSASIIFPPSQPPTGVQDHVWSLFLDACRFRGRDHALSQLPLPLREKFKNAVDDPNNQIWRAKELWSKLPESLKLSVMSKYY
ncbi:hypothetical protein [Xanthobacter wiegelii]|uniref:hypothetical protein n=1 Tax=Xanthobacter wiegelii TaxID=3119913 RepID=UPI00372B73F6